MIRTKRQKVSNAFKKTMEIYTYLDREQVS